MQHIQSAIPSSSSNLKVKNTAAETHVAAEKPAATEKTKEAPQAEEKPVSPIRQETVDEAAMMAIGGLEGETRSCGHLTLYLQFKHHSK